MRMLRDPVESAINLVVSHAREASQLYEDAAAKAESPAVQALFRDLSVERRRLAARLERSLQAMGELPEDPDADAVTLHRMLNAARGMLSDADRRLLEDRERAESRLFDAIQAACEEDLPEDVRSVMARARLRVEEVRDRLRHEASVLRNEPG